MRQVLQFFPVAKPIKSHVDKLRLFPFQSKKNSFHVNFCQRGLRKIPNGIDSLYTVSSNTRKLSNQFSHLTSRGFGWKWYCESYLTTTKVKWLKMVSPTLKCCMGFIEIARQNQIHLLTSILQSNRPRCAVSSKDIFIDSLRVLRVLHFFTIFQKKEGTSFSHTSFSRNTVSHDYVIHDF